MISNIRTALVIAVLLSLTGLPMAASPRVTAVVNGASYEPFVSPGAVVSIFGDGLAPRTETAGSAPWPTELGGISVTVDGILAPLSYVSSSQINAQIPFEVGVGEVSLVIHTGQQESSPHRLSLLQAAPGIFTLTGDGKGTPVMLDSSFKLLDEVSPGQRLTVYATGLGQTDPPAVTGAGSAFAGSLRRVIDLPEVILGGMPAIVEFAGLVPGWPGIYQLNLIAPWDFVDDSFQLFSGGFFSNWTQFTTPPLAQVRASGVIVSEVREIEEFHRLQMLTVGAVDVQVGPEVSLRIVGDDNILPLITTTMRDGTLVLGSRRPFWKPRDSIRFELTVPNLDHVSLRGVGSIVVEGVFGERFGVTFSGVGSIRASGAVNSLDLFMKGVGSVLLDDLSSERTRVWMSGMGNAQVNARQSLFARVFGFGRLIYSGNPVEVDVSGNLFGRVRPR